MENKGTYKDGWFEIQVESDLKNLEVISDFLTRTMRELGATNEKDICDVQLSVDEAVTNIMEHAYQGQKAGLIKIRCSLSQKREFIVSIRDSGKPFDPRTVAPPDIQANLEGRKVGGLGIYFMKTLMQSVKYAFDDMGNELTMTKLLR